MQKRGIIVMIILVSLFLISCKPSVPGGEKPLDTAAAARQLQSGTAGIETIPLANTPPPIVYDRNELVTIVEVRNAGNHDVEPSACFVQITGFDPRIIRGGYNVPRSCAEGLSSLNGRDIYNLEGDRNQIEFRSSNIQLDQNVFEYNPQLNIKTCYSYSTTATPQVCVDPLFYQITSEQKTCTPRPVSLGGGQGGPVGVSWVGVDMIGDAAIFDISIKNYGNGRVLSPFSDVSACDTGLGFQDVDKILYNVEMPGASIGDCTPTDGFARLYNGQGKITCRFSIQGGSSYETPLTIKLDYNYIQSQLKPIKIIRTPQ